MNFEQCAYRTNVRRDVNGEYADCRLLALQLAECPELSFQVTRDICTLCFTHMQSQLETHPVFPSVVFEQCERALAEGELANADRVRQLRDRAEEAILNAVEPAPALRYVGSCDVVLCCDTFHDRLDEVIESAIRQAEVSVTLHLIDTSVSGNIFTRFSARENVLIHHCPAAVSELDAVHDICAKLGTEFIALQSPRAISSPNRLSSAISELRETGAEILGSRAVTGASAIPRTDSYEQFLAPETLVFRRATFVDMGGSSARSDAVAEFVFRAACEGRRFVVTEGFDVQPISQWGVIQLGTHPGYSGIQIGTLRKFARGFPAAQKSCDVVLPFHGQLEYVEQALVGLLESGNDDIVVHLIDDCSPVDTDALFRRWGVHRQVRTYRNVENIAQFQSFNNMFPYLETDLVAVQDADDISRPNRFAEAATLLHYADADYFGGAVEMFGDKTVHMPVMHETKQTSRMVRSRYRASYYPKYQWAEYFMENPTSVFRKSMFERVGGYADFGGALVNRASLDTEFQIRCFYSGVRFAVTREVVLDYRVHAQSATQDNLSGWGTKARAEASLAVQRRRRLFLSGPFDARSFGALGRYQHATQRITFPK
ncbi:MAG: glycosyltransferase [Planctomycetaceae bacterium]